MSKAKAQRKHARKRSYQRLGFVFDEKQAIADIKSQKAEFIEKQSNRVSVWKMEQDGTEFYAIYDKSRKTIVTVMTERPIG